MPRRELDPLTSDEVIWAFTEVFHTDPDAALEMLETMPLPSGSVGPILGFAGRQVVLELAERVFNPKEGLLTNFTAAEAEMIRLHSRYPEFWCANPHAPKPPLQPKHWHASARYAFAASPLHARADRIEALCAAPPRPEESLEHMFHYVPAECDEAIAALQMLAPSWSELATLATSVDPLVLEGVLRSPQLTAGTVVIVWETFASILDRLPGLLDSMWLRAKVRHLASVILDADSSVQLGASSFLSRIPLFGDLLPTSPRSFTTTGAHSPSGGGGGASGATAIVSAGSVSAGPASAGSAAGGALGGGGSAGLTASVAGGPVGLTASVAGGYPSPGGLTEPIFEAVRTIRNLKVADLQPHLPYLPPGFDFSAGSSADLIEALCQLTDSVSESDLDVLIELSNFDPLRFTWLWEQFLLPKLPPALVGKAVGALARKEVYLVGPTARAHLDLEEAAQLLPLSALVFWGIPEIEAWAGSYGVSRSALYELGSQLGSEYTASQVLMLLRPE